MTDDNRKYEILKLIIRSYIESGEAVGSRTIEKRSDIGVSSATIRNEMSDLEDLGFLTQPHTSAGRVPTQKAYRKYVDDYMKISQPERAVCDKIKNFYSLYSKEYNEAIKNTAELASSLTGMTAIVTTPHLKELNIRDIHLIPIEGIRVLMVLITKQGICKTREIHLSDSYPETKIQRVESFLNACLKEMDTGFTLASFNGGMNILDGDEQKILMDVIEVVKRIITENNKDQVYSSGTSLLFDHIEFSDMTKARKIIDVLQKDELIGYMLFDSSDKGVTVRIGTENELEELEDCTLITSTYEFNSRPVGAIGLIGPMRTDYDRVVSIINYLKNELSLYFDEMIGGKK